MAARIEETRQQGEGTCRAEAKVGVQQQPRVPFEER